MPEIMEYTGTLKRPVPMEICNMARKKENTVNNAGSITPILDNLHTGNWVRKVCAHVPPGYLCKNWNGDGNQEDQPCLVNDDNYMSCPYLVKTKLRDPLV